MNLGTKAKTIGMILLVGVLLAVPAGIVLAETPGNPRKPECEVGLDKEWLPHGDGEWVSSCGFISLERGGVVSREVELVKLKVEGNYSIFALVPTEDGIVAVPFKTFFGIPFEEHIKEYTREIDIAFIERKKQLMRVKDSIDVPIIEEFDVEMWITTGRVQ
ncbi:hypothetical protein M1N79_04190 [Dehalococcoidia bacterium]|nr:hypothetical protein [Dehalococcoidia bacterium]